MNLSPQQKIAWAIALVSVVAPFIIMAWNASIGVVCLFVGLMIAYRAIRFSRRDAGVLSDATIKRINQHQSERGRTIQVQLVDDFGRELPPDVAQKRLAEAQAQAGPRDTVVGVRYKMSPPTTPKN